MNTDDITNIIQSPQWNSSLLWYFLSGAQQYSEGIKNELVYLALPVTTDRCFREKLLKANKASTLSSLFNGNELKASFATLSKRVVYFRDATSSGIIYLGSITEIKYGEYISVAQSLILDNELSKARKEFFRAAYYLGGILAKENHLVVISRFIGVGYENYIR